MTDELRKNQVKLSFACMRMYECAFYQVFGCFNWALFPFLPCYLVSQIESTIHIHLRVHCPIVVRLFFSLFLRLRFSRIGKNGPRMYTGKPSIDWMWMRTQWRILVYLFHWDLILDKEYGHETKHTSSIRTIRNCKMKVGRKKQHASHEKRRQPRKEKRKRKNHTPSQISRLFSSFRFHFIVTWYGHVFDKI